MKYCMIVATDKNNGFGKNQTIPWHVPEDLKYFSKLTKGNGRNAVIMGRKTYESIGRPLPHRLNIVITSQKNSYNNTDKCIFTDLNSIENICISNNIEEAWIIGGSSIYQEYMPKIEELYITLIDETYECDTFFVDDYEELFKHSEIIKKTNNITYKKLFTSGSRSII